MGAEPVTRKNSPTDNGSQNQLDFSRSQPVSQLERVADRTTGDKSRRFKMEGALRVAVAVGGGEFWNSERGTFAVGRRYH
jgi:hypothetical protein